MSFYFQLSRFSFLYLCFQFWRQPFHFMFQPFVKVRVLCVHFMYKLVLYDSCNLVFCFILTTRLYA